MTGLRPAVSPILSMAEMLHNTGFNVFPQFYGRKGGLPWKIFNFTRLLRSDLNPVFRGQCNIAVMTGKTSRNLFVIDCESEASFQHHLLEASRRKLAQWVAKTPHGGHIYLLSRDSEIASILPGCMDAVEVRGRGGYVIAPPSKHPDGLFYEWYIHKGSEPPTVTPEQIDWLVDQKGHALTLKLHHPARPPRKPDYRENLAVQLGMTYDEQFKQLSKATLDYLQHGDNTAKGQRNSSLFKAICDMSGCGYGENEIELLLAPIALDNGLDSREIEATIRSGLSRHRTPSRPKDNISYAPNPQAWQHAHTYFEHLKWSTRTGDADHRVALALVERAKRGMNENQVFRASEREVAQLARLSRPTVRKALRRLQEDYEFPLIHQAKLKDRHSGARLWQFSHQVLKQGAEMQKGFPLISSPGGANPSGQVSRILGASDAMERGALGLRGLALYQAMLDHGVPVKRSELPALGRMTVAQTTYTLGKLRTFGLVTSVKHGYWQALEKENFHQEVAEQAGTQGKGHMRAERFRRERAIYAGTQIIRIRKENDKRYGYIYLACPVCGCSGWTKKQSNFPPCPECAASQSNSAPESTDLHQRAHEPVPVPAEERMDYIDDQRVTEAV